MSTATAVQPTEAMETLERRWSALLKAVERLPHAPPPPLSQAIAEMGQAVIQAREAMASPKAEPAGLESILLAEIIRQMPIAIAIAEAPSGRLVMASDSVVDVVRPRKAVDGLDDYGRYVGRRPNGTYYKPDEWPLARAVIKGEHVKDEEFELELPDGSTAIVSANAAPVRDAQGRIVAAVLCCADVTQQKRAAMALQQSEERFRLIAEMLPGMCFISSSKGESEYANNWWHDYSGTERGSAMGHGWVSSVHPEDLEPSMRLWEEAVKEGQPIAWQLRLRARDGVYRWFRYRACVMPSAPDKWLGIGIEIDDLKRAEAEIRKLNATLEERVRQRTEELEAANRELSEEIAARQRSEEALRERKVHYQELAERNRRLVQEVDHRVRNNLAGLEGLVQVTKQRARTVDAFAEAILSRLSAMSHIHQLMADGGWGSMDLESLVGSTMKMLQRTGGHHAKLEANGPVVTIRAAHGLPLTMILVEWFTNATKYGAFSVASGKVNIGWEVEAGAIRLHWHESGGPAIDAEPTPSLGTELVQAFASRELGGRCRMRYPRGGADHELIFAAQV